VLTSAELTDIQTAQVAALPATATIRRLTRASDGGGGFTTSWSNVATGVACRTAMRSQPLTLLSANQEAVLADWVVTLPVGTAAQAEDEILTGGRTLVVIGPVVGPWATCLRLACVERR
jgi:hypothetical protein